MPGRQLANVREHRLGTEGVAGEEEVGQPFGVERRAHSWVRQEALDLRRAEEPIAVEVIMERFDTDAVARHEHALLAAVPDCEREHAIQVPQTVFTLLLVEVDDYFRIGM